MNLIKKLDRLILIGIILTCTSSCALFNKPLKIYSPEMVKIEGGTYVIGDFYENSNSDALPRHQVVIEPFLIGKYEVTFEQYDQFALDTESDFPDDGNYGRENRAVVDLTWDDAVAFCKSLGYRLPTEAEWEYAARSGGQDHVISGTSDIEFIKDYAIIRSSGINFSFFVGTKRPNDFGLYDMSGNVFEWIGDFYQFYSQPEMLHDNEGDGIRIIRGGSFGEEEGATRTYWRVGTLHDVKATDIGFRCAKSL